MNQISFFRLDIITSSSKNYGIRQNYLLRVKIPGIKKLSFNFIERIRNSLGISFLSGNWPPK